MPAKKYSVTLLYRNHRSILQTFRIGSKRARILLPADTATLQHPAKTSKLPLTSVFFNACHCVQCAVEYFLVRLAPGSIH